ncbi:hypothetical protein ACFY8B_35745 [Streptomyces sp. NPDC012751]|uniref:hypothetical protein n=1 Tax=Streptomyces sp. NPDC012751 TaxID=3364846 RepID=UPI0036AEA0B5
MKPPPTTSRPASGVASGSAALAQWLPGTPGQRRQAAQTCLLRSADDPGKAAGEWRSWGFALLTAGVTWDAVRADYDVLHPDFDRSTDRDRLAERVDELSLVGPVFCDPYRRCAYFLVPPGTDKWWTEAKTLTVECLGGTRPCMRWVGVPVLDRIRPPSYFWLVPPDCASRQYVDPNHLHKVLHAALSSEPVQQMAEGVR